MRLDPDDLPSWRSANRPSACTAELAMERCAAGDHTALNDLFDAIAPPLSAHLARRIESHRRVDRIVRAVMLELHHARGSYVAGSDVLPWAIAIARRLLRGRASAERVTALPRREGSTASTRLHHELARLAEPMRSAWELVCLDRLTPTQAAAVLGIGRAQLQARLQEADAVLGPTLRELDGTLDEGRSAPERAGDSLEGALALGRYRVERRIGGGAHGDVYLAADLRVQRTVALKILRTDCDDLDARQRRFVREVELLRRVDDRGLVPVFDVGRLDNGRHFYAMEYLQGNSLAEVLATRGHLPWSAVGTVVEQICATLGTVHDRGIVHRDLKPANCFLEGGVAERVRLLDFGVAKLTEASGGEALTSPGMLLGTPEYMAPEQLRGEPVDARTDVYALGVTMYESLVGRRPFVGESLVSIITQHLFGRPVRPSEALGDPTLVAADHVILRALAKDPAERYASAADLADAVANTQHRKASTPWMCSAVA